MLVSEQLAGLVAEHGSSVMFGLLGDANLYLIDAFQATAGNRFIAATHERETVLMAAGYAAASGRVGVATVTHGAITNCVSALCDAVAGGYPVVVLSGETAAGTEYNLQRLPQAEIVRATGAEYVSLTGTKTLDKDIRRAFTRAREGNGVVVVGIPSDFQKMTATPSARPAAQVFDGLIEPDPSAIEAAAGVVLGSNRPVLVLGRGCIDTDAEGTAQKLATFLDAPICTTLAGQGLAADAPFNLGIMGTLSNPVASKALAASDCLIVFGASLNHMTTLQGELLEGKRVVQFDVSPTAFGRYYPVDVGIMCGVGLGMQALLDALQRASDPRNGNRLEQWAEQVEAWHTEDRARDAKGPGLDIRQALHRIDEISPVDRWLSVDIGRFGHQALNTVGVSKPGRFVHAGNIAQIGLSVAYGAGAWFGAEGVPSVVIAGDGGFMLGGIGPFNTAVRHEADLIVFIMNDQAYGAEYYRLAGEDLNAGLAQFGWPDFAALAAVLGGDGLTVRTLDDFGKVQDRILHRDKPLLVDVVLDPGSVPDPGIH